MVNLIFLMMLFTLPISEFFAQKEDIKTVKIGNQLWMAKNLDVDMFRNGDPIPKARTKDEWENLGINKHPAWCYYQFDESNGKKYGKLYNWYAVNDSRGLAPLGYHIPNDAEWSELIEYLGGEKFAGYKMKSKTGWNGKGNGDNSSGFNGLPGGGCIYDGNFSSVGEDGYWWSSTEVDIFIAWFRNLFYEDSEVYRSAYDKNDGYSVRCLRDKGTLILFWETLYTFTETLIQCALSVVYEVVMSITCIEEKVNE